MSPTSGVTRPVTVALQAAAARAGGTLRTLDVSGCVDVRADALLAVVTANAGTLRELRAGYRVRSWVRWSVAEVEALLHVAPLLRVLGATVACSDLALACRLLRNEGHFERLRMRCLWVDHEEPPGQPTTEADVLALAASVPSHASLTELLVESVVLDTAVKLDAVVEAALTHRLRGVWLSNCSLSRASLPALVRLCGSSTLVDLCLEHDAAVLPDVPAALALGNALRANTSLTELGLANFGMWRDPAVGAALLGALTGHRSLRVLILGGMHVPDAHHAAAGAALGALVAANAPALHELDASWAGLDDEYWCPLLDALPCNTHLRKLDLSDERDAMSEAFTRDRLVPAVRANTSLRKLHTDLWWASAREAEELVRQRAAADE
jgi:hypothetical protein